ncbi:MAG: hypothetical protein KG003_08105 [Bacteroidetes bacterium]|nr:hypothetical protein [Bacteroidota bacterium]
MILIDFNQIMISNASILFQKEENKENFPFDDFRFMVLNSLRKYNSEFREYGKLIICCEGAFKEKNCWRHEEFEFYKYSRREKFSTFWGKVYQEFDKLIKEFQENIYFPLMRIRNCEADDVIGILSLETLEKSVIISADKDFQQLQNKPNIFQYDPLGKRWIKCPNPKIFLKEQIIKGDRSDGIPNCLSPDDSFAKGIRQKTIFQTKLSKWIYQRPEQFLDKQCQEYYQRNKKLIFFHEIPAEYKERILNDFSSRILNLSSQRRENQMRDYFNENGFIKFLEKMEDFV